MFCEWGCGKARTLHHLSVKRREWETQRGEKSLDCCSTGWSGPYIWLVCAWAWVVGACRCYCCWWAEGNTGWGLARQACPTQGEHHHPTSGRHYPKHYLPKTQYHNITKPYTFTAWLCHFKNHNWFTVSILYLLNCYYKIVRCIASDFRTFHFHAICWLFWFDKWHKYDNSNSFF